MIDNIKGKKVTEPDYPKILDHPKNQKMWSKLQFFDFLSKMALRIFLKLGTMMENNKGKKVTEPDYSKKFWIIQKIQKCGQNDGFLTFSRKPL